jgi:hypothetical protein
MSGALVASLPAQTTTLPLTRLTRDEAFTNEGIYVSFAQTLDEPRGWSTPRKIVSGGDWYPQVAGSEPGYGY